MAIPFNCSSPLAVLDLLKGNESSCCHLLLPFLVVFPGSFDYLFWEGKKLLIFYFAFDLLYIVNNVKFHHVMTFIPVSNSILVKFLFNFNPKSANPLFLVLFG